jgi:hypothetical protein
MLQPQEQSDETTYKFEMEGVAIKIRAQSSPVRVRKLPLGSPQDYHPEEGDFIPTRLVIHFEIIDENGNYPTAFDPPYELEVRYTAEDMARARNLGASLTLWYYDGKNWQPFTEEKHGFRLLPDRLKLQHERIETGGCGIAYITNWADPPVGWSP